MSQIGAKIHLNVCNLSVSSYKAFLFIIFLISFPISCIVLKINVFKIFILNLILKSPVAYIRNKIDHWTLSFINCIPLLCTWACKGAIKWILPKQDTMAPSCDHTNYYFGYIWWQHEQEIGEKRHSNNSLRKFPLVWGLRCLKKEKNL